MTQPESSKTNGAQKINFSSRTGITLFINALLIFFLFLAYFLSQILPTTAGYENSPLEWTETLFLLIGFGTALFFALQKPKTSISPLWLVVMPFWLMFCGRELSWGAALLPPVGIGDHGPILLHLRQLPYHKAVYPILAVLFCLSLYIIFKERLLQKLITLLRQKRFPLFPLAMAFLAAFIASGSEHHLFIIHADRNQLLEELMEFVCYIGLFITQIQLYIRTKPKS